MTDEVFDFVNGFTFSVNKLTEKAD